jgi:hypothetical protein
MHDNKSMMAKNYTSFASHFDGHGDVPVQYSAQFPTRQV